MNKERLLKLADLLESDAKNKKGVSFDLTAWAQKKVEDKFSFCGFEEGEIIPVSCDTAACAWGLGAISGAFAKEGVGYKIKSDGRLIPFFGDLEEFDAAASFFDIDDGLSVYFLFDPEYYPDKKLKGSIGERFVAKRIRDLVNGKVTTDEMRDALL